MCTSYEYTKFLEVIYPQLLNIPPSFTTNSFQIYPDTCPKLSSFLPKAHPYIKINTTPYKFFSTLTKFGIQDLNKEKHNKKPHPSYVLTLAQIQSHVRPKPAPICFETTQHVIQICPHFAPETFEGFKVCFTYKIKRHAQGVFLDVITLGLAPST